MAISRSQIPQQISKGANKMMKKKGYKMGGKVKMKRGGKVKTKGMKKGGAVMSLAKIRSAAKSKGYKLVKA